jgi:hypothetical protein
MAEQGTRTSLSAVFQDLTVSESLGSTQKMHGDDGDDLIQWPSFRQECTIESTWGFKVGRSRFRRF